MKCNINMSKCPSYDDLDGFHKYNSFFCFSAVLKSTFHEKNTVEWCTDATAIHSTITQRTLGSGDTLQVQMPKVLEYQQE